MPPSPARLVAAGAALVARAGLTLDIGVGRRLRPLGPITLDIAASPEIVFDVIAAPYLGRTPRALRSKLEVIERGADLVLAAHFTPVAPGLTVTTVETVRFERPAARHVPARQGAGAARRRALRAPCEREWDRLRVPR